MKRPRSKSLTRQAVQSLLAAESVTEDENLTKEFGYRVCILGNGGLLLVFDDGKGLLYASAVDARGWYQAAVERAKQGPINPWPELLPLGEKLPTQIDALISSLTKTLQLDDAALLNRALGLRAIDRIIQKRGGKFFLHRERFSQLIAYLGEVLKERLNGRWTMEYDESSGAWMPAIASTTGFVHRLAGVYKELYELNRRASMEAYVEGVVLASKLRCEPHA